jgi:hypothetical protein
MIHSEDYEHEARKDEIYLMEKRRQMEIEWQMWEEHKNQLPAKIEIVIKSSPQHEENKSKTNSFPF